MSASRIAACLAAASLVVGSTAAVAAPTASPQPTNAWAAFSVLNGSASLAGYCSAGAAGCVIPQVDTQAPAPPVAEQPIPAPVPGIEPAAMGGGFNPLFLLLGALAAAGALYLILHKSHDNNNSPA